MPIPNGDRILWFLSLLDANGGGARKTFLLDKLIAIGGLTHSSRYIFLSEMRGWDWIEEKEGRDGDKWVILTQLGKEELAKRRGKG